VLTAGGRGIGTNIGAGLTIMACTDSGGPVDSCHGGGTRVEQRTNLRRMALNWTATLSKKKTAVEGKCPAVAPSVIDCRTPWSDASVLPPSMIEVSHAARRSLTIR